MGLCKNKLSTQNVKYINKKGCKEPCLFRFSTTFFALRLTAHWGGGMGSGAYTAVRATVRRNLSLRQIWVTSRVAHSLSARLTTTASL